MEIIRASGIGDFFLQKEKIESLVNKVETQIRRCSSVNAYCNGCEAIQIMTVSAGADFGEGYPNLREGLVCSCGTKNRDRLMILASRREIYEARHVVFFGVFSGWAEWARRACPDGITFCEYFPDSKSRGLTREIEGITIRNEDMTNMMFPEASADLILHQDVLEHIPNFKLALFESLRVLRPGGKTIFTAPFFHLLENTIVRAELLEDGTIKHLLPEERHGDPLSPDGILAFYNFGWSLIDILNEVGFVDVGLNIIYCPDLGLVSNGCPGHGNMLPGYITATKP